MCRSTLVHKWKLHGIVDCFAPLCCTTDVSEYLCPHTNRNAVCQPMLFSWRQIAFSFFGSLCQRTNAHKHSCTCVLAIERKLSKWQTKPIWWWGCDSQLASFIPTDSTTITKYLFLFCLKPNQRRTHTVRSKIESQVCLLIVPNRRGITGNWLWKTCRALYDPTCYRRQFPATYWHSNNIHISKKVQKYNRLSISLIDIEHNRSVSTSFVYIIANGMKISSKQTDHTNVFWIEFRNGWAS